jgi:glucose-6-phosphate-specific signal transduction histidine kinase
MMRLPIPAILAALVVVAAGSVLLNVYFKSDAPYVLDVSDLKLNETKVVELDYIPSQIRVVSNDTHAWYEISIYIDGTFVVTPSEAQIVEYNEFRAFVNNGTVISIKPVDVKSTHVKIVVRYVYSAIL